MKKEKELLTWKVIFDRTYTFESFKKKAIMVQQKGWPGWSLEMSIDGTDYERFTWSNGSILNKAEAWKEAYRIFDLIIQHQGQININGIFVSNIEYHSVKWGPKKKMKVQVDLSYSGILDLWFFAVACDHPSGGSSSGISVERNNFCQDKDVAIFYGLLEGWHYFDRNTFERSPTLSVKDLEKAIKLQFEKIRLKDIPSNFGKIGLPDFLFF